MRAKTNSEGKAELKGFNAKLMGGLKVTTDTYGSQLIGSASKRDWQIRLQPVGSLRLKLVGADATKAKGSMLRIQSEPLQQAKQPFANTSAMQTVAFDGQGELVIPKILAGDLQMWPWFWPLRNEYLPELPIRSIVRPGTETVVEIKLLPSVEVKGRVVLEDSLEPGRSVGVDVVGRGGFSDVTKTDDQGNFRLYTLPGPAQIGIISPGTNTGRRYRRPKTLLVQVPPASPQMVPDVVMEKIPDFTFHLADAAGQPLADTELIVAIQLRDSLRPVEKLKTASDGSCRTPLDFIDTEKRLRDRDPDAGIRFFLATDYIKQDPKSSVPLKETRRSPTELWLQK